MTLKFSWNNIIQSEIFSFSNDIRICYWTAILLFYNNYYPHDKLYAILSHIWTGWINHNIYQIRLNSNDIILSSMLFNYLFICHTYNRLPACKSWRFHDTNVSIATIHVFVMMHNITDYKTHSHLQINVVNFTGNRVLATDQRSYALINEGA